jgi:hypothetical protein
LEKGVKLGSQRSSFWLKNNRKPKWRVSIRDKKRDWEGEKNSSKKNSAAAKTDF